MSWLTDEKVDYSKVQTTVAPAATENEFNTYQKIAFASNTRSFTVDFNEDEDDPAVWTKAGGEEGHKEDTWVFKSLTMVLMSEPLAYNRRKVAKEHPDYKKPIGTDWVKPSESCWRVLVLLPELSDKLFMFSGIGKSKTEMMFAGKIYRNKFQVKTELTDSNGHSLVGLAVKIEEKLKANGTPNMWDTVQFHLLGGKKAVEFGTHTKSTVFPFVIQSKEVGEDKFEWNIGNVPEAVVVERQAKFRTEVLEWLTSTSIWCGLTKAEPVVEETASPEDDDDDNPF